MCSLLNIYSTTCCRLNLLYLLAGWLLKGVVRKRQQQQHECTEVELKLPIVHQRQQQASRARVEYIFCSLLPFNCACHYNEREAAGVEFVGGNEALVEGTGRKRNSI